MKRSPPYFHYCSLRKWGAIFFLVALAGCHQGNKQQKVTAPAPQQAVNVISESTAVASKPSLQQSEATKSVNKLIHDNSAKLFSDDAAIVVGNPDGAVTLIEFYDYQCHYCRNMAATIIALTKQNTDLRVLLRQLPIMNRYSILAARSAMVAETMDASKFVHFHELLMQSALPFGPNTIPQAAKASGYDSAELFQLSQRPNYEQALQVNRQLATTLLMPTVGRLATPVTIVGPTDIRSHYAPISFIPGFYSQAYLQTAINKVKQGVCTASSCG